MRIVSLKINNFRAFTDAEFTIGKNITVLSGTNAVGKSTILGLLGNSCELKADKGKPILQPAFRWRNGDELFKMSPILTPRHLTLRQFPMKVTLN